MTVLAILVVEDDDLAEDALVVLGAGNAVVWRGLIDDQALPAVLRQPHREIRMHPKQIARQAALAAARGEAPIALD